VGAGVLENELAEQESDPYLISLARSGDSNAFGKLYARHVGAAGRLARVLARDQSDADDLVAETFTRVLAAVRAGRGPDTAFRAYLLTTLRHALYDRARRERRIQYTDDLTPYERLSNIDDPVVKRLETSYAARAFARLPERWRAVLWHTEVEGETPAQVAPLLGLTPNGVAALAYRARERLRQMYLQEHIGITNSPRCHWAGSHLAGYVRAQLARRDRSKVEGHLAECPRCRSLHRELTEENSGLRGVLAALLLGAAAPAYLASSPVADTGIAGWFAAVPAGLAPLWHHFVDLVAIIAGTIVGISLRLHNFPGRLIERFGPGNVIAAGGLVAASTAGVAAFASVLISGNPIPPAPPRPAPHQPPAIALPTPSARLTPPPLSPAPPQSMPPQATPLGHRA
jgi:RNA polymerase sigma factor (sigma-70 family)